jgi:multiple sugar transport system substrate-binding protein
MVDSGSKLSFTRRRLLQSSAGALGAAGTVGLYAPAVIGQAKPLDGVTLNVSCWSAPYPKWLADYIPEFEAMTGAKVNYDTPGFPIYNQRVDLELSTQGSAFDVLNITFIYTSRWIGAGWFEPLQPYMEDPTKTPPEWQPADFLPGAVEPLKDKNGVIHGLPWIADAYMGAAGRFDLLEQAGLGMPDTFDDIVAVCQAVNDQDGVKAFVNENHHGWTWIPYLHGFGGDVFVEPPDNLMPSLDTPEAIAAAEYYSRLLKEFGPDGVLSYTYDQSLNTLKQGRANYTTFNQAWLVQLGDAATSKVAETVNYSLMPQGPAGRFPGVASHGWGIPVGSQNKDAAWEFIKWAMSPELMQRMLTEKGYGSQTRLSIIDSPEFKQKMTVNGHDVAKLYVETIDLAAAGHMKYRTVHVYPQVDKQIDKAIENIVSGQMSAAEAMKLAQANSIADLKRSGLKL